MKKKEKRVCFISSFILIFLISFQQIIWAAPSIVPKKINRLSSPYKTAEVRLFINNEFVNYFEQEAPFIYSYAFPFGKTQARPRAMLPLERFYEYLGATVTWDQHNSKIIVSKDNDTIEYLLDGDVYWDENQGDFFFHLPDGTLKSWQYSSDDMKNVWIRINDQEVSIPIPVVVKNGVAFIDAEYLVSGYLSSKHRVSIDTENQEVFIFIDRLQLHQDISQPDIIPWENNPVYINFNQTGPIKYSNIENPFMIGLKDKGTKEKVMMIPLKRMYSCINAEVSYDDINRAIKITKGQDTLEFIINGTISWQINPQEGIRHIQYNTEKTKINREISINGEKTTLQYPLMINEYGMSFIAADDFVRLGNGFYRYTDYNKVIEIIMEI